MRVEDFWFLSQFRIQEENTTALLKQMAIDISKQLGDFGYNDIDIATNLLENKINQSPKDFIPGLTRLLEKFGISSEHAGWAKRQTTFNWHQFVSY
jgi:hypothetical protein